MPLQGGSELKAGKAAARGFELKGAWQSHSKALLVLRG